MKINLKESLNELDMLSDNRYDLYNTYLSKNPSLNTKKKLSEAIYKNKSPKEIALILKEAWDDAAWHDTADQEQVDQPDYFPDGEEESEWTEMDSKSVRDSDGFLTDYTWYWRNNNGEDQHVFVFGDSDLYGPEDGYFDWECDSLEEAQEWFDSYVGPGDDEDNDWMDESLKEEIDNDEKEKLDFILSKYFYSLASYKLSKDGKYYLFFYKDYDDGKNHLAQRVPKNIFKKSLKDIDLYFNNSNESSDFLDRKYEKELNESLKEARFIDSEYRDGDVVFVGDANGYHGSFLIEGDVKNIPEELYHNIRRITKYGNLDKPYYKVEYKIDSNHLFEEDYRKFFDYITPILKNAGITIIDEDDLMNESLDESSEFEAIEYICFEDNKIALKTDDKDRAISFAKNNPEIDQVLKVTYNDPLAKAYNTNPSNVDVIYDRMNDSLKEDYSDYDKALAQVDKEAEEMISRYDKGDESIFDILSDLGYVSDDPNSVYMYKEVGNGNAIVFDLEPFDDGKGYVKYFVVDDSDKIPSGYTSTRLFMDESLDEDYTWDLYNKDRDALSKEFKSIPSKSDYRYKFALKKEKELAKKKAELTAKDKGSELISPSFVTRLIKKELGYTKYKTATTSVRGYNKVLDGQYDTDVDVLNNNMVIYCKDRKVYEDIVKLLKDNGVEVRRNLYDNESNTTITIDLYKSSGTPKVNNESLNEKMMRIEPSEKELNQVINVLNKYGFKLDDNYKPGRGLFGSYHIQVINPDLDYIDFDQLAKDVEPVGDALDDLSSNINMPITYNFGTNDDNVITGGIDIHVGYKEDDMD